MAEQRKQLRRIDAPFVASGPAGVAIRDRLKHLEAIRVTPDGEVSIKLPVPLAYLANARCGRYVLPSRVAFQHRGTEWRGRIATDRAVAYRIHRDTERGRWYLTASWTRPVVQTVPLEAARAKGIMGVDTNADHLAAYRLDVHGNPVGDPKRFFFDLTGPAEHRDAQTRHAEKTREKHGSKRFRQVISGMPTGQLKARVSSMAAEQDLASIAIGRRALGHSVRRRTTPPRDDQSDRRGYRTVQADPGIRGSEEPARPTPFGTRAVPGRELGLTPGHC